MPIKYTLSQTKTIENLGRLFCAFSGEDGMVTSEKPDPNGRTVEVLFESESSSVRAMIDGGGAIQSIAILIDGRPHNPNVDLSNLFGLVQRNANPKKAN
jgi:hypothetical protein